MSRLRFRDFRLSRAPRLVGLCKEDSVRVADYANAAEERLLFAFEAADEGWWGSYAEMAFTVSRTQPYLTTPRGVARLQFLDVCERPMQLQNQFYEYLQFGNGRLPKQLGRCGPCSSLSQAYTRNSVPTFTDITGTGQFLVAYPTDPTDANKKVIFSGLDATNSAVYGRDGLNPVRGEAVALAFPFAPTVNVWNGITGIQKDLTNGPVQIFQMDPTTGAQILLLTMEPGEEVSGYRRYYFDKLPISCCTPPVGPNPQTGVPQNLSVTAIAALEHIDVRVDSDYFVLQNLEALINEAQSIYYEAKESAEAKAKSEKHHRMAIRLLIGELTRMVGNQQPAISFKPFGSATLERARVGYLI